MGNVWLGTGYMSNFLNGLGLFIYQMKTGDLNRIGTGTERINDIFQDSNGRIWMATNKGIGRVMGYSPGITNLEDTYYEVKTSIRGDGLDVRRNNFSKVKEFNGEIWAAG